MESIKANIHGDGVNSSVEFSMEEVIARHHGKPWDELDNEAQEAVLKGYALTLFSRQSGMDGKLEVTLEPGTFTNSPKQSE